MEYKCGMSVSMWQYHKPPISSSSHGYLWYVYNIIGTIGEPHHTSVDLHSAMTCFYVWTANNVGKRDQGLDYAAEYVQSRRLKYHAFSTSSASPLNQLSKAN
jgi:hypothetical protein